MGQLPRQLVRKRNGIELGGGSNIRNFPLRGQRVNHTLSTTNLLLGVKDKGKRPCQGKLEGGVRTKKKRDIKSNRFRYRTSKRKKVLDPFNAWEVAGGGQWEPMLDNGITHGRSSAAKGGKGKTLPQFVRKKETLWRGSCEKVTEGGRGRKILNMPGSLKIAAKFSGGTPRNSKQNRKRRLRSPHNCVRGKHFKSSRQLMNQIGKGGNRYFFDSGLNVLGLTGKRKKGCEGDSDPWL